MRQVRSRKAWAVAAALVVTAAGGPGASAGAQAKVAWRIAGEFEEACSCAAACPCWFGSKPTRMKCGGGFAVFIEKGNYGAVALDGLAVATAGQSPAGKSMMESFGAWEFSNIYVDERATPEQRKGLEAIMQAMAGPASRNTQIRYVPLTRTVKNGVHTVHIGQHGSFSGRLDEGGLGGLVKVSNPPAADPLRKEYHQGHTEHLKFTDAGQDWDLAGTNYMHHRFDVTSEDYEKFAAAMAQKMAPMKSNP
jgi:hypothetical protein